MKAAYSDGATLQGEPILTRRKCLLMLGMGASGLLLYPAGVLGQTQHTVTAHNRDPDNAQMAFAPAVLRIRPGDTVRFVHADRGHNFQSYDNMLPEGAVAFEGGIGEELEVSFDVEGTYGYFCRPHQAMGMIGYILVGDFTHNLVAVRAASSELRGPMMARRVAEYLGEATETGQAEGLI